MSQVKPVDLSIIILAYKSKEHLKVLLPSVFASEGVGFGQTDVSSRAMTNASEEESRDPSTSVGMTTQKYSAEVIVVDNGSNDGTVEWLKASSYKLTAIANANIGFSAGNNVGIKKANGKYILLLNPDTKLEPNTLKLMLDFMEENPEVGIAGCKLIKGNGKLDLACRRRFPNPLSAFKRLFLGDNTDYNYSDVDENISMEVDSVVGAFMMFRKIGELEKSENRTDATSDTPTLRFSGFPLLDPAFFMYGEDIDLCWRVKEAGYKVWYYPKAVTHHFKGESSKQIPFKALKWFHDAMWIFYKKHYYIKYSIIVSIIVFIGIYSRLLGLYILNLFRLEPRVSR